MADQKTEPENPTAGVEEAPSEEAIRQRAYEISQREGAGSAAENWQLAEAELRGASDADGEQ